MPHKINPRECAVCGACEAVCEHDATALHSSCEYYAVDPEKCIDCGDCVEVCPTEAIAPGDDAAPDPQPQADHPATP